MKPILLVALSAIVLFTTSCGLSDKEKLAVQQTQQAHDDSVRTAIYTANDEMTQIKAFHFGRLSKDRDAQVQAQELKIQTLLLNQSKLQTATAETLRAINATKTALAESN